MDKELIVKTICAASEEVFSTMLGIAATSGSPHGSPDASPAVCDDSAADENVLALIGIAGSWIGTGSIRCSPSFACKVGSIMLMGEYETVNVDVLDAMAEIANMIFGNVKTVLEEHVGALGLSIPTVVYGRNFTTSKASSQLFTEIPLYVDGAVITVAFHFAKCPQAGEVRHGYKRSYSLTAQEGEKEIEVLV